MAKVQTLDELMAEWEPERLAEIAKGWTPEAIAKRDAKAAAERQRQIDQGLRDASGEWIETAPEDDDEDEDEDGEQEEA